MRSNRKAVVAEYPPPIVDQDHHVDGRIRVAVDVAIGRVTQGSLASPATLAYGRNPVGIHQGRQRRRG
jgi:hypothetical protein